MRPTAHATLLLGSLLVLGLSGCPDDTTEDLAPGESMGGSQSDMTDDAASAGASEPAAPGTDHDDSATAGHDAGAGAMSEPPHGDDTANAGASGAAGSAGSDAPGDDQSPGGTHDAGTDTETAGCGSRGLLPCPEHQYCDFPESAGCGEADAPGTCADKPQLCTLQYDPVCGCDGTTYGNDCAAAAAGVSVRRDGEC